MSSRNWSCPFCHRAQSLTDSQFTAQGIALPLCENKYGQVGISAQAIACANDDCQEISLSASLVTLKWNAVVVNRDFRSQFYDCILREVQPYKLRPSSFAKHQPDYIPQPLKDDYYEACAIRDLSPKASATLARRCLQGMIRNFCGISKATLFKEIEELEKQIASGTAPKGVNEETVEAFTHVRKIGNIGAHMEKDINEIIDVDPNEAQVLIELIELVFDEWYVARQKRQDRLAKVAALGAAKSSALPKPSDGGSA